MRPEFGGVRKVVYDPQGFPRCGLCLDPCLTNMTIVTPQKFKTPQLHNFPQLGLNFVCPVCTLFIARELKINHMVEEEHYSLIGNSDGQHAYLPIKTFYEIQETASHQVKEYFKPRAVGRYKRVYDFKGVLVTL